MTKYKSPRGVELLNPYLLFVQKLDTWARKMGVSYTCTYWDAEDCYEVEIISAAKNECFYHKRNYDFDVFLDMYNYYSSIQVKKA